VNWLPKNAFVKLHVKSKPYFDDDNENEIKNKLPEDILSFSKSWNHLMKYVDDECTEELYLKVTQNEEKEKDIPKPCKTCENCNTMLLHCIN